MVAKIKEGVCDGKVKANSLVFRKKQWLLQRQIEPRPDCKALNKWTHHLWLIAHTIVGRPCCIHFHTLLHFVACCWEWLGVVARSLKLGKLLSPQLPTIPSFRPSRTQHHGDLDPDPSRYFCCARRLNVSVLLLNLPNFIKLAKYPQFIVYSLRLNRTSEKKLAL